MSTIADIYAGKLDAADEVSAGEEALSKFIHSIVLPDNLSPEVYLPSDKCFISGYKGTGKTAILLYLRNYACEKPGSYASFIGFKTDVSPIKRFDFQRVGEQIISLFDTSGIPRRSQIDYEYIWLWYFYCKIIDDDASYFSQYRTHLFRQDDAWADFCAAISSIATRDGSQSKYSLSNAKVGANIGIFSGEAEISLSKDSGEINRILLTFISGIEKAESAFKQIESIESYYLFVDELEPYYGDDETFHRDLQLIRDLLFVVKRLSLQKRLRIICSVRTEVLNAIPRFIPPKELNKAVEGFDTPLRWIYKNNNSINHPIIQILLKRIRMSDNSLSDSITDKQLFDKWFQPRIRHRNSSQDTVYYILDLGWNKPRDIVRLLKSAQEDNIRSCSPMFTQSVLEELRKNYSISSLKEIREELQTLYTPSEIEDILRLFRGYGEFASIQELTTRITDRAPLLQERFHEVLEDLYRVGLIGNHSKRRSNVWRWQHKGDSDLITQGEWEICVHNALHSALSIVTKYSAGSFVHNAQESGISGNTTTARNTKNKKEDKIITCIDCGQEFSFSIGEQEFYAEKGLGFEPRRCSECRTIRKRVRYSEREMFEAICTKCGGIANLPFRPHENGRPVFCSDCFALQKAKREC